MNDELEELKEGTEDFIEVLNPQGRLAIISFHSLEDRIVKEIYNKHEDPCECPKNLPCTCGKKSDGHRVNKKPITANEEELAQNHRARSAKLRVFEKA